MKCIPFGFVLSSEYIFIFNIWFQFSFFFLFTLCNIKFSVNVVWCFKVGTKLKFAVLKCQSGVSI